VQEVLQQQSRHLPITRYTSYSAYNLASTCL
jgi:hypothetical protein